jgi:hypothetical protein
VLGREGNLFTQTDQHCGVECLDLRHFKRQATVNTVIKFTFFLDTSDFLSIFSPVTFSKETLLLGVRSFSDDLLRSTH